MVLSRSHVASLCLLLAACGPIPGAPPRESETSAASNLKATAEAPPQRPRAALVVPGSGAWWEEGRRALRGAEMAFGESLGVQVIDALESGSLNEVLHTPGLAGVIVWAPAQDLSSYRKLWEESDLFVVVASNDAPEGLPRVVPDTARHARCASALLPGGRVSFVGDGSPRSEEIKEILRKDRSRRAVQELTVDLRTAPAVAESLRASKASNVIYLGEPRAGASLLRSLRELDSKAVFYGVDLYRPEFLEGLGRSAEGAIVTTPHRPVWDESFLTRYNALYQETPSPAVVDTYDAALLLKQVREASLVTAGGKAGFRINLGRVSVQGAGGAFKIDESLGPEPSFCSSHELRQGRFLWREAARLRGARAMKVRSPGEEPAPVQAPSKEGFLYSPPVPASP